MITVHKHDPLISVIICTHNRAKLLNQALASLAPQNLEEGNFEIIVVDNGSTDNTAQVVDSWRNQISNLRYIYEPKLGLSVARNIGARAAQAPLLAYLDDDVIAHSTWLAAMVDAYYGQTPRPACIGGRILLRWEGGQRPPWLPDKLLPAYGFLDLGDQPRNLRHATGCNMAVDKEILQRFGGFSTALGRIGDQLLAAEESNLQLQFRKAGLPIVYEPKALVEHWVPISKQTPAYLYRIFYYLGISESIQRRTQRSVSRGESIKLIARALIRMAGETFSFGSSLLQEGERQHNQILWTCAIKRYWGFIYQEIQSMLEK